MSDRLTAEDLAALNEMADRVGVRGPLLRTLIAAAERAERYEQALREIDAKGMNSSRSWITDLARAALKEAP